MMNARKKSKHKNYFSAWIKRQLIIDELINNKCKEIIFVEPNEKNMHKMITNKKINKNVPQSVFHLL